MGVVLGIDFGQARIGIAASDGLGMIANALETLKSRSQQQDIDAIAAIVKERSVETIVVGLPINMNGTEGPMAESARKFAAALRDAIGLRVVMWDERMSTMAAENALLEADMSRKKRKGKRDQVAAAWFLQSYLDAKGNGAIELDDPGQG